MMDKMNYPNLECELFATPKDQLADCLGYNNLKVGKCFYVFLWMWFFFINFLCFLTQGLQQSFEDESTQIASGNLRSEIIELRHQAEEKEVILDTLANELIENHAKFKKLFEEKYDKILNL